MMKKQLDLILDVESTDLFGIPIAFGAIVMDGDEMMDAMAGRIPEDTPCIEYSEWVKENVFPAISSLPQYDSINDTFLRFCRKHKGCRIWSDVNFPVETRFLTHVFQFNPSESPYPLLDIANFLHPDIDRLEYCGLTHFPEEFKASQLLAIHNPLHDAYVSWMAYRKYLKAKTIWA